MSWSSSGATAATSAASSASSSASASWSLVSWSSGLLLLKELELSGVLDEWRLEEVGLWPKIWGQEGVGVLESSEGSLAEVLSGSGLSGTLGVDIIDTGELQDLLGNLSGNATSSSWSWHESN